MFFKSWREADGEYLEIRSNEQGNYFPIETRIETLYIWWYIPYQLYKGIRTTVQGSVWLTPSHAILAMILHSLILIYVCTGFGAL